MSAIPSESLQGWFTKAGEKRGSAAKRRYFILDELRKEIRYYAAVKNGTPADKKGSINLKTALKLECKPPKLFIHCPGRIWELNAEQLGQVEEWAKVLSETLNISVVGISKGIDDAAALAASLQEKVTTKVAEEPEELPFGHRIIHLQRPDKMEKFGVQFRPYEGVSDGVEVCGVTEGGPAHNQLFMGEKVVRFGDESLDGMTYPAAVHLISQVVGSVWSVLTMEVAERERFAICVAEYVGQEEGELTLKEGDRIRVTGEPEEGWQRGISDGVDGWFPSDFVEYEELPEVEAYAARSPSPAKEAPPKKEKAPKKPKEKEEHIDWTKWPEAFPDTKIWNHGKISRQVLEERAKEAKSETDCPMFLARMKDKTCFSLCIKYPQKKHNGNIVFVLFEKTEEGHWLADKEEFPEKKKTLPAAVEAELLRRKLRTAVPVPKPE